MWLVFFFFVPVMETQTIESDSPAQTFQNAQTIWADLSHSNRFETGIFLMELLYEKDQYHEALQVVQEIVEKAPFSLKIKGISKYSALINDQKQKEAIPQLAALINGLEKKPGKDPDLAQLFNQVGTLALGFGDFSEAQNWYQSGIPYAPENAEIIEQLHGNLGVALAQQGKLQNGLEHFLIAERLHRDIFGKESVVRIRNIGAVMIYLEKWEDSIKYTKKALDLLGEEPSPSHIPIYNNLGTAYLRLEKTEEARNCFLKSFEISETLKIDNFTSMNNLGFLLLGTGKYEEALQYLRQAEDFQKRSGQGHLLAIVQKNMGEAYQHLGQLSKAEAYFQSAYELYASHDLRHNRLELYPVFIRNCVQLNQFEKAYLLMREFKELNDEVVQNSAKGEVEELQARWELERKEKDLQLSELEQEKQAKLISQLERDNLLQSQIRIFLVVGLFASIAMVLLLYRSLRFRKRAHVVLREKNVKIEQQNHDLEHLNHKLELQSFEDVLTGLKNRRYFDFIMESEVKKMARSLQNRDATPMLFILADLDHFKKINDKFGHPMGDQVLQMFADCLKEVARESDILVRWGGEEFLWVCRDASFEDGSRLCDRLSKLLALRSKEKGLIDRPVTVSMGFAEFPFLPNSLEVFHSLKVADLALYRAKRSGRDGWVGYQNRSEEGKGTSEDLEQSESKGLFGLNASPNLTIA